MKNTLLILAVILVASCGDNREPIRSITGRWQAMLPNHPNWIYDFQNGLLTQSITDFNTNITTRTCPYAERGDTLFIGGDLTNEPRRWILTWEADNIVHIDQPDVAVSALRYLKRVQD